MKVLTIKQPWASLIMLGLKKYEFRSWKTEYRGELLIHAGKGIDKDGMERLKKYIPEDIPYEGIIGKVKLIDCIKTSSEFYDKVQKENKDIYAKSVFNQDYAWQMEVIEVYDNPIKVKGKLRLWNYEGGVNGKEEQ